MEENSNKNYISLHEATKYCDYSQKYLNLRVRQGKLKAVKMGRNWVTTKEWVEEYIKAFSNGNHDNHIEENICVRESIWKNFLLARQPSSFILTMAVFIFLCASVFFGKNTITNNLNEVSFYCGEIFQQVNNFAKNNLQFSKNEKLQASLESAKFFGKTGGLLFTDSINGVRKNLSEINNFTADVHETFTNIIAKEFSQISSLIINQKNNNVSKKPVLLVNNGINIFTESLSTTNDYTRWVSRKIFGFSKISFSKVISAVANLNFPIKKIFQNNYYLASNFITEKTTKGVKLLVQFFEQPEKIIEERIALESKNSGLVVIPSAGREKNEIAKQKIKESFSDEVKVEPTDDASGIITPIFRKGEGEGYLYMLVPMKN